MAANRRSETSSPLLDGLRRWADPVTARAGFTWNESGHSSRPDGRLSAVLYEADPIDFMRRYPESDLQDSYPEDEWPPPCVDLWLKFDWGHRRTEVYLEGFEVVEHLRSSGHAGLAMRATRLTDDGDEDARMIATALATVLGVPGPEGSSAG